MTFDLSGIYFGAAYYAEYQTAANVERDFDLMRNAGFTVIRVGESVWSTWEPRAGVFNLDWLQPILDTAQAKGLAVILGTPTYAIPPWLQLAHPEIAAERASGIRVPWGSRQEMDQSQPAYRWYAERIIRKVVERYAEHPAIVGFQVDNEPGLQLPHNESTFRTFVEWLKSRYGTLDAINDAWGLVYWSHRLSDWAELWRPDGNLMPQYQLEWRRFQSTLATDFIGWQADIVRTYARGDQFITTCVSYSRPQLADDDLVRSLDIVAGNPYYMMQEGLNIGASIERQAGWWHSGVAALFQWADRAFSSAGKPFFVTETNAQSIGGPFENFPPFPGQTKQAALALISRGARMIEYWQWNTLNFGAETYWGGVLPHSQVPGRIYREVSEIGALLKAIGPTVNSYQPDADVLMIYSTDTAWSFEFYPPLALSDGQPNSMAYQLIFDSFYQGAFDAGAQVRVQHVQEFNSADATELARQYPVLIAPALYVANDETLDHLVAYAEAGGHLVLGIRTGYGDELARARLAVAPDRLTDAAGVHYEEYSNLRVPVPVEAESEEFSLEPGSAGTEWVDVLEVDDAQVLVSYAATESSARAAVTTRRHGQGRVTYIGTIPNRELAVSIGRWLTPETATAVWRATRSVTVTTGRSSNRRVVFVSNWSAETASVTAPSSVRNLADDRCYQAGDLIELQPRAALVFEHPDVAGTTVSAER